MLSIKKGFWLLEQAITTIIFTSRKLERWKCSKRRRKMTVTFSASLQRLLPQSHNCAWTTEAGLFKLQ